MPRPAKGVRLERRTNSPFWYAIVPRPDGRPLRKSTGETDRRLAEVVLAELVLARKHPVDLDPQELPLARLADLFTAARLADDRPISAPERIAYAWKPILGHFADARVSDLTPAALRGYTAHRRGRGIADGTLRRELSVLRSALIWAKRDGVVKSAPAIVTPRAAAGRERALTDAEVERLRQACAGVPHLALYVEIALNTGARRGAILGLDWRRVDLEHRRIDFNEPGRATGNKRRTVVPVNDDLAATLAPRARDAGPVIHHRGRAVADIKTAFNKACLRAGLGRPGTHCLRYSAGLRMARGGVPLWEVAQMLGHSHARTTELYARYTPDHLRAAAAALSRTVRKSTADVDDE